MVATIFIGLYPRVMVSSTDFANSLTVDGASSAHYTLAVMTVVAVIVFPLILLYQGWTLPRVPGAARRRAAHGGRRSRTARSDGGLMRALDRRLVRRARAVRRLSRPTSCSVSAPRC